MVIAVLGSGDATIITPETPLPAPIRLAGAHCKLLPVADAVFPATEQDRVICERTYYLAGIAAAAQGAQGIYINTVGDYGLKRLQKAVDAPVVGAGSGAIKLALQDAESFSIVTVWPPAMRFIYEHMLSESGLTRYCNDITHLSQDDIMATADGIPSAMAEVQACGVTTLNTVINAIDTLHSRFPGGAVMLGCTCMYPMAPLLSARGVEVVEPMSAGYRHIVQSLRPQQ